MFKGKVIITSRRGDVVTIKQTCPGIVGWCWRFDLCGRRRICFDKDVARVFPLYAFGSFTITTFMVAVTAVFAAASAFVRASFVT